ncbi:MAG: sulfite exporter TauE/SafE family protein [Proteobacteria bacterium]|nr:sulfite exporter TauE/SafE family protein [Pseudomonadota bacterium]
MSLSIESLTIIFLALAVGSLVKGISGLGLPMVAIPVMAGFMPVDKAVAIMVIPSFVINIWLMWVYRQHAVKIDNLPWLFVAGIIGVVIGALMLSILPNWYLVLFMALWLGGYLFGVITKRKVHLPEGLSRHRALAVVGIGGVVQGSVGSSGPVIAPYVHSLGLTQQQYVYGVSILFQIFGLTQLLSFIWLGLIDLERTYESLLALIPIAIFLPLAVWLSKFFNPQTFNVIVIGLLIVIELRLIIRLIG